jgi:hypothetical protein
MHVVAVLDRAREQVGHALVQLAEVDRLLLRRGLSHVAASAVSTSFMNSYCPRV